MKTTSHPHSSGSGVFPGLVFVQGNEQTKVVLNRTPFSVGRKVDKDLVIADPRVSRDHALIVLEDGDFFLLDQGSKHGTFVNGERIQRQKLERNDRLEFGARDSAYVIFNPAQDTSNTAREFLSQISGIQISQEATDLEKLTLFLEAARKLNTIGVLDEILVTMLDVTLRLIRAERAYVFLKEEDGKLRLAAGRNAQGEPLLDDKTISHSILEESLRSNSEFLLSDTSQSLDMAGRQSIVAYDLRTVVCIPLRKMRVQSFRDVQTPVPPPRAAEVLGVLYLDSRFASRDISGVGHDILHVIATEAASLIENARLVQAEEEARRYQQELAIAASIQQRLMQVKIPEVPFARLRALLQVVEAVNRFFTEKLVGEKYATMLLARLRRDGDLEYVNCGHVPPLLICNGEAIRPPHGNVPVGLLADVTYESSRCQLNAGDSFIMVTDGVTEAENAMGEFFEDSRLEAVAAKDPTLEGIFSAVAAFCGGTSLGDDCTVVELYYKGQHAPAG